MNRREIAVLACRIMAVWFFTVAAVNYLDDLVQAISMIGPGMRVNPGDTWMVLFLIVPGTAEVVAGLFLWMRAEWLAERMTSDNPALVNFNGVTAVDLLSVALAISGVSLFASAIERVARQLALVTVEHPVSTWHTIPVSGGVLFESVLEAGLALWLIFGSKGLAALIQRLRHQPPKHEG